MIVWEVYAARGFKLPEELQVDGRLSFPIEKNTRSEKHPAFQQRKTGDLGGCFSKRKRIEEIRMKKQKKELDKEYRKRKKRWEEKDGREK